MPQFSPRSFIALSLTLSLCLFLNACLFKEKIPVGSYFKIETDTSPTKGETKIAQKNLRLIQIEILDDSKLEFTYRHATWFLPSGTVPLWFKKMASEGTPELDGMKIYEDGVRRFMEGNILDETTPFLGSLSKSDYENRVTLRQTFPYQVKNGSVLITLNGTNVQLATYKKNILSLNLDADSAKKLLPASSEILSIELAFQSNESIALALKEATTKLNDTYTKAPAGTFPDKPLTTYLEKHRALLQIEWEAIHGRYYSKVTSYVLMSKVHQSNPETIKSTLLAFQQEFDKAKLPTQTKADALGITLVSVAPLSNFPDLAPYLNPTIAPSPAPTTIAPAAVTPLTAPPSTTDPSPKP